jgi:hypothetical protein
VARSTTGTLQDLIAFNKHPHAERLMSVAHQALMPNRNTATSADVMWVTLRMMCRRVLGRQAGCSGDTKSVPCPVDILFRVLANL